MAGRSYADCELCQLRAKPIFIHCCRPYMYTAYTFAAVGAPFALAKLLAFDYPKHSAVIVLVLLTSLMFTGLHLMAAHNMVRWARHRSDMGLDGFGYPWEVRLSGA